MRGKKEKNYVMASPRDQIPKSSEAPKLPTELRHGPWLVSDKPLLSFHDFHHVYKHTMCELQKSIDIDFSKQDWQRAYFVIGGYFGNNFVTTL